MPRVSRLDAAWRAPTTTAAASATISAACHRTARPSSADVRDIEDAAVFPEMVDAAGDAQRRDVAVDALAVVADLPYDARRPVGVDAQHRAEPAVAADEPLHAGIVAGERLLDRLRAEPQLLRVDH